MSSENMHKNEQTFVFLTAMYNSFTFG